MQAKPINKSKKSNRRCVNCKNWPGYQFEKRVFKGGAAIPYCEVGGRGCDYWNCCPYFDWNPNKLYLEA